MRKSAMGSSKYEFEPELLDLDVKEKLEVAEKFKEDLRSVLHKKYRYREGFMSDSRKRDLLREVHKEFLEKM